MRYLETGQNYEKVRKKSFLTYPTKKELPKIATKLYDRLFPVGDDPNSVQESLESDSDENDEPEPKKSRREKDLKALLDEDEMKYDHVPDTLTLMKKEMMMFELNPKQDQPMLSKLKGALDACVPTSVESERCFSAAGQIVTKFRTRLRGEMLDKMIMLKSFFKD